jgi:hypothetical protein
MAARKALGSMRSPALATDLPASARVTRVPNRNSLWLLTCRGGVGQAGAANSSGGRAVGQGMQRSTPAADRRRDGSPPASWLPALPTWPPFVMSTKQALTSGAVQNWGATSSSRWSPAWQQAGTQWHRGAQAWGQGQAAVHL